LCSKIEQISTSPRQQNFPRYNNRYHNSNQFCPQDPLKEELFVIFVTSWNTARTCFKKNQSIAPSYNQSTRLRTYSNQFSNQPSNQTSERYFSKNAYTPKRPKVRFEDPRPNPSISVLNYSTSHSLESDPSPFTPIPFVLKIMVNSESFELMVDTGATISCISPRVFVNPFQYQEFLRSHFNFQPLAPKFPFVFHILST